MQHFHRPSVLTRRSAGLATFAVLALLLGASLLSTGGAAPASVTPAAVPAPSYAALRPLLRAGEGKGLDEGLMDIYQLHVPFPTAWVWVVDDTGDGSGVEYRAQHETFVHPGGENEEVSMLFVRSGGPVPGSLEEFVTWIVESNPHVMSEEEVVIHMNVVSTVDPHGE